MARRLRQPGGGTRTGPFGSTRGLLHLCASASVGQLIAGVSVTAIIAAVAIGEPVFALLAAVGIHAEACTFVLTAAIIAPPLAALLARTIDLARRREYELKRRESLLLSAQRLAQMGHWRVPLGSRRCEISGDLQSLLGLPEGANEIVLDDFYAMVLPEDRERVRASVETLVATRQNQEVEYRIRGADGTLHAMRVDGSCEFDHAGRLVALFGAIRDVTPREALLGDLRLAKEEAEAASRTKSEFLANMSHELRTPLNAIIGFSEIIATALFEPVAARYRDYARDINSSGLHLLKLINDVLDISKIEAGRLELHKEPVAAPALIEDCRRLVAERAASARVELTVAVASDLPPVAADALRLKQILLNVLANAVKFTPPGGRVAVSATLAPEGGVTFTVRDTGIGMHPEEIPLALEPFRQIETALNRRYEGTGLGLPLARRLTELHDGIFDIESAPGRGTTVAIRLPPALTLREVA